MFVIHAANPDHALSIGIPQILANGVVTDSRNGPVLRFPRPVTTMWSSPMHRVSFSKARDANPFLHLIESMWMLNGNNDVATIGYYAKQMLQYTDDGETLNGAYGFRWRNHFGYDQLDAVIAELRKNPGSRRCVISMWDGKGEDVEHESGIGMYNEYKPSDLLNQTSKDLPCNTAVYVDICQGKLNITVTNRSNDMIWGAYGANAVHYAFLHEYLANKIGVEVGNYYQVSNNLHIYTEFDVTKRFIERAGNGFRGVEGGLAYPGRYDEDVAPLPLQADSDEFEDELRDFVTVCTEQVNPRDYENQFLDYVAMPMARAYNMHKAGDTASGLALLTYNKQCLQLDLDTKLGNDWLTAGIMWLGRRMK
jgi:thymidylate synthase